MPMPLDLVLVRHGQSEGNVAAHASRDGDDSFFTPEFTGRHSWQWRLSNLGREQARVTGDWLRQEFGSFDRYYTSVYIRAKETAYCLDFPGAEWRQDIYLRERDRGDIDVMSASERKRLFGDSLALQDRDPLLWSPPNGESLAQVCMRVDRVLDTLHRETAGQKVIVVAHGEVFWAFRARLERLSLDEFNAMDADPGERIRNCQVVHYSRIDPATRGSAEPTIAPYLNWVRFVAPYDDVFGDWQRVERKQLSNADLLADVEAVPRLIDG
jgi:broad specificity phosphatase PhoE